MAQKIKIFQKNDIDPAKLETDVNAWIAEREADGDITGFEVIETNMNQFYAKGTTFTYFVLLYEYTEVP